MALTDQPGGDGAGPLNTVVVSKEAAAAWAHLYESAEAFTAALGRYDAARLLSSGLPLADDPYGPAGAALTVILGTVIESLRDYVTGTIPEDGDPDERPAGV